jgi:hypothetical protein
VAVQDQLDQMVPIFSFEKKLLQDMKKGEAVSLKKKYYGVNAANVERLLQFFFRNSF